LSTHTDSSPFFNSERAREKKKKKLFRGKKKKYEKGPPFYRIPHKKMTEFYFGMVGFQCPESGVEPNLSLPYLEFLKNPFLR